MDIDDLLYKYELLINPKTLLSHMNFEEFEEWCLTGTKKDLKWTLIQLEQNDMFEHCIIVKRLIENNYN